VNAAWLSHLKAMQLFLDSGHDFALIAEDDFHVENREKLMKILRRLQISDWDLIQFGFLKPGIDTRIKILIANIDQIIFKVLGKISLVNGVSKLGFASRMRVKQSLKTPKGFVIDDCQPGAHFYLVGRTFCQSILKINNPQFLSIDDFYTSLSRMRTFKMIRVKRSLVSQKPFTAWIGPRFKRGL
jgi:GR25 family glycosyltransferase involved in LPS biosynthesis